MEFAMNRENFCNIELSWDDFYWLGKSESNPAVEIHINSMDEEPSPPHFLQIHAWEELQKDYETTYQKILDEVLIYYVKIRPTYVEMGPEWVESMPVIRDPKEIIKMITLNYICINWPYDETTVNLSMSFSCSWEQEHGLGVVLENNVVKEVGDGDCAII